MFEAGEQVRARIEDGFGSGRVLVVGDVMLDRYIWGRVARISPEAPVPVVHRIRDSETAGGAANVALNLAGLGLTVELCGLIGDDPAGRSLVRLLRDQGISGAGLVAVQGRPTVTKTRVIGDHQQMLRIDDEDPLPPVEAVAKALMERVRAVLAGGVDARGVAAIILSDYAKGCLSRGACQELIAAAGHQGIPVLADPKGSDFSRYAGADLLSPNRRELAEATGVSVGDLETLLAAGDRLRRDLGVTRLLVTLSEQGLALVDDVGVRRIPAVAREVFDVSGAGDTVIAVAAAGLAAGLRPLDALHLANLAAGVVVGRVGTAPVSGEDLLAAMRSESVQEQSRKVCDLEAAVDCVERWRAQGERVVFTNGCFDLLHAGHVNLLEQARRQGQRLVVGMNTDRSVRALKGPSRPVIHQGDRAQVMAALEAVDAVVLFDGDTPLELIRRLRPDVLVKGADYRPDQVVGGDLVRSWGGEVVLLPLLDGRSTSGIVEGLNPLPESGSDGRP